MNLLLPTHHYSIFMSRELRLWKRPLYADVSSSKTIALEMLWSSHSHLHFTWPTTAPLITIITTSQTSQTRQTDIAIQADYPLSIDFYSPSFLRHYIIVESKIYREKKTPHIYLPIHPFASTHEQVPLSP